MCEMKKSFIIYLSNNVKKLLQKCNSSSPAAYAAIADLKEY